MTRPRTGWTIRRLVSVVAGGAVALCALGAFAVGGVLAAGGVDLDLGGHGRYHAPGYALVSGRTNAGAQLLGTAGAIRVRAAADGAAPIFVGVAAPAAVDRYLRGVAHTTVRDDGEAVVHDGAAPATPPGDAVAWTATATGAGVQTLRWDRDAGSQVLVAMNADGSPSVRARVVSSTATLRARPALAAGALAGGAALLALAVALIVIPLRRVRGPRAATTGKEG
jgi:hypothetical protein